jgi:hypothetical protein
MDLVTYIIDSISHRSEAGKPEIEVPADLFSDEGPFPGLQRIAFLLFSRGREKGGEGGKGGREGEREREE